MKPSLMELGKAAVAKGDVPLAIQQLSEALNDDFFNDEALFMLGACLQAKGMNGLSAVVTSAAIDARLNEKRNFPEALMNLGAAYKAEHRNDVAERIWREALSHETIPRERAKILCNLSGLFVNEGQPEKAIELCNRALAEDPKCYNAIANRGMANLELGNWREGWDGWRATLETGDRAQRIYPGIPVWDGSPGKKVIVWGDQGVGDEIYYASCLADMIARCEGKVIFDCHPRLPTLFERSFPGIVIHGTRKDLTELPWLSGCDAEASIGLAELPGFCRKAGEWDGKPYLKAADARLRDGPGLRIGLSWTGGSKRTRQELRSLPIEALAPIVKARPDARWFSLQYTDMAAGDVCRMEEQTGIRISHYPGWVECRDYDRTASFVASLDLVITVCTTVHHLAGALGVPVWTMVPSRPSWRYMVRGETLPWYGSAKLYRQETDGDWSGVIERIRSDLADL